MGCGKYLSCAILYTIKIKNPEMDPNK
jgi:hypothetical protein